MDINKEVWEDVWGYEGLYRVSNMGRVLSLKRNTTKGGILSPGYIRGYQRVHLSKLGEGKTLSVHRLVLLHFVPNPDNKEDTNHKNGIKDDNRVENLEWATRSENLIHACKTGLRRMDGEYHPEAKLNNFIVRVIRKSDLTQVELADIFNVTQPTISYIKNDKTWT